MASEMGPDGLPRDRTLNEDERAELERIQGVG
jgi:hypothetical protein